MSASGSKADVTKASSELLPPAPNAIKPARVDPHIRSGVFRVRVAEKVLRRAEVDALRGHVMAA